MASKDKKASKGSSSRVGGIRTLSDLNRPSADSDSDSDGPQEYYTGGEKSGMLVQDPSKDNSSNSNVDAILDRVRQLGAVEGPTLPPPSDSRSFTGTGRLLSGETTEGSSPQQPEAVLHNIVFWTNGFTVNDGPLRRFDDPENISFLESIKKSEYPKELEPADWRKTQVHVNLTKRNENFPEPEKREIPFQGQGRTLGSSSAPIAPAPASGSTGPTTDPNALESVVVDETQTTTSIQFRLADGTRLIGRFNHHHTISNIRSFIDASRPECPQNYVLQMMGFPPKVLGDPTQTIEQAGLANSVVIQKF